MRCVRNVFDDQMLLFFVEEEEERRGKNRPGLFVAPSLTERWLEKEKELVPFCLGGPCVGKVRVVRWERARCAS